MIKYPRVLIVLIRLQVFSHLAANMTEKQQHVVVEEFILVFLSQTQTGTDLFI